MIPLADFDDSPGAAERQARALSTLKLTRPVGAAFEYSNLNYNLLGLIIEAASGESYADYIQDHIFTPLGHEPQLYLAGRGEAGRPGGGPPLLVCASRRRARSAHPARFACRRVSSSPAPKIWRTT